MGNCSSSVSKYPRPSAITDCSPLMARRLLSARRTMPTQPAVHHGPSRTGVSAPIPAARTASRVRAHPAIRLSCHPLTEQPGSPWPVNFWTSSHLQKPALRLFSLPSGTAPAAEGQWRSGRVLPPRNWLYDASSSTLHNPVEQHLPFGAPTRQSAPPYSCACQGIYSDAFSIVTTLPTDGRDPRCQALPSSSRPPSSKLTTPKLTLHLHNTAAAPAASF